MGDLSDKEKRQILKSILNACEPKAVKRAQAHLMMYFETFTLSDLLEIPLVVCKSKTVALAAVKLVHTKIDAIHKSTTNKADRLLDMRECAEWCASAYIHCVYMGDKNIQAYNSEDINEAAEQQVKNDVAGKKNAKNYRTLAHHYCDKILEILADCEYAFP